MPWETYEPSYDNQAQDEPRLTIYKNRSGYLNGCADETWFDGHDTIVFHADPGRELLAIEPAGSDGDYTISRGDDGFGGDVATQFVLRDSFGIEDDDITDTSYVDLEWNDERGWAVADVSELLDDESDPVEVETGNAVGDSSDKTEQANEGDGLADISGVGPTREGDLEEAGYETVDDVRRANQEELADVVGRPLAARIKADVGDTKVQGDATVVDDGDGDAAVPDVESAAPNGSVREAAEKVDTLSELADQLDTSNGEARLLARKAGVLTEVRDDIQRMGDGSR